MAGRKISEFNHNIVPADDTDGSLNLFDLNNPDINLFNAIDDELIKVSGSKVLVYTFEHDGDYDDLFDEKRSKTINPFPKVVWGHYAPRALEENLTEFGIEITNDQMFTFNKAYLEAALRRPLRAGDIIKPAFQNLFYEVFEVQEDNFAAYGVFHLIASAKVLREAPEVFPEGHAPEMSVMPELRGYEPYSASQGYRLKLDDRAVWTAAQKAWIKGNARSILFTRNSTKERRDDFGPLTLENGKRGLYVSFTTISNSEREQYGAGIDQFLAKDSSGNPYSNGTGGESTSLLGEAEHLARFWDEDWLEARWNLIPGTRLDSTLKDSGLDYIYMDLCNLYPGSHYIGDKGNPLDTSGAWREAMVKSVEWVRTKLDGSIGIVVNGIRQHVDEHADYLADYTKFYNVDGTDLIVPELANAGTIKTDITWVAVSANFKKWIYTLRTILRSASENKACYTAWTAEANAVVDRLNNWVSYSLVHQVGLTEFGNEVQDTSPAPLPLFPENRVDLGKPLQSPDAFFGTKDSTSEKVFTRDFSNGYTAFFNFTESAVTIPSKYSSYKKVVLNTDIVLNNDGTCNGTLIWSPLSGSESIAAFQGIMLKRNDFETIKSIP